jgi:GNAT superfamily N-acetyltransferase
MNSSPADWSIRTIADSFGPDCDLVLQWLREHNEATNPTFFEQLQQPEHQPRPLVLLAATEAAVIGGLFAETQLAWLRISIMAVKPEFRSKGIGSALLAEAERQAVARGCKHAYVDTMSYQAPQFYAARGFHIVGEIPDWDSHGHTKYHFAKGIG